MPLVGPTDIGEPLGKDVAQATSDWRTDIDFFFGFVGNCIMCVPYMYRYIICIHFFLKTIALRNRYEHIFIYL